MRIKTRLLALVIAGMGTVAVAVWRLRHMRLRML